MLKQHRAKRDSGFSLVVVLVAHRAGVPVDHGAAAAEAITTAAAVALREAGCLAGMAAVAARQAGAAAVPRVAAAEAGLGAVAAVRQAAAADRVVGPAG